MKKKTASLQLSNTAQTMLLAGFLLVASAVFLSQVSPLFAKAVPGQSNIRGIIVLSDTPPTTTSAYSARASGIALPGNTCNIIITACQAHNTENPADAPYRIYLNKQLVASASIKQYANFKQVGYDSYLAGCYQTGPVSATGGLNTVSALQAYVTTNYLSVAYDCTP